MSEHEQCTECGHIRYIEAGDSFNGECIPCCVWAERQARTLRAEVARSQNFAEGLQCELTETIDKWNAEVAALKATVNRQTAELLADESHCLCRADVYQLEQQIAALKAELKKYTEDLTNTQREAVAKAMRVNNNPNLTKWDAAIRRVRRGE